MSQLPVIATTVQKTHEWLRLVADELQIDDARVAYSALRGVLHALRDHIETDEVAQLGAQLPMLVRGLYYEGWDPHPRARRPRTLAAFLGEVYTATKDHPELDDPEDTSKAVLNVLADRISIGEMRQVVQQLPKDFRELWSAAVD